MNHYTHSGCVALVTGAASGLGKGLADAYAKRGLYVVYADINAEGARAAVVASGANCEAAHLDVANAAACVALIDDIVARKGRLDLMFNCAGFAVAGEVQHTTIEDWRRVVDVNLLGNIYCATHAYKQMVRQGGGQIANIASLGGLLPMPLSATYATTKAGLINFSHTLRCEGIGLGIQVTVICPSFIETNIFNNAQYRNTTQKRALSMIPLPFMPLDKAVQKILAGVDANKATLVFPLHARLLWLAQRLFAQVPNPVTNRIMKTARRAKP